MFLGVRSTLTNENMESIDLHERVYNAIVKLTEINNREENQCTLETISDHIGSTENITKNVLDELITSDLIQQKDNYYVIIQDYDESKVKKFRKIGVPISIPVIEHELRRIKEYQERIASEISIEDVQKIFQTYDVEKMRIEAVKILCDWRDNLEGIKNKTDEIRENIKLLYDWIPKLESRFNGWMFNYEELDVSVNEKYWVGGVKGYQERETVPISSGGVGSGYPAEIEYYFRGFVSLIHIIENNGIIAESKEMDPDLPEKLRYNHMYPITPGSFLESELDELVKIQKSKRKAIIYRTIRGALQREITGGDPVQGAIFLDESFLPPDMKVADLAMTESRQAATIECIRELKYLIDDLRNFGFSRSVIHFRFIHHRKRDFFIKLYTVLKYKDNMDEFFVNAKIWELNPYGLDSIFLFKELDKKYLIIREKLHAEYFSPLEQRRLESLFERNEIPLFRKNQYQELMENLEVGVVMFPFENLPVRIEFLTMKEFTSDVFLKQAELITKLTSFLLVKSEMKVYPTILLALDPELMTLRSIFATVKKTLKSRLMRLES